MSAPGIGPPYCQSHYHQKRRGEDVGSLGPLSGVTLSSGSFGMSRATPRLGAGNGLGASIRAQGAATATYRLTVVDVKSGRTDGPGRMWQG